MRRKILAGVVLLALGTLGWWLFGYSTVEFGGGEMRLLRFFGRVVRAEADVNGDGRVDEQYLFSWSEPMRHHQPPQSIISDRNLDGRWDLWITPLEPDSEGYALSRYDVDTDADGRPDWRFVAHPGDSLKLIRDRRGF